MVICQRACASVPACALIARIGTHRDLMHIERGFYLLVLSSAGRCPRPAVRHASGQVRAHVRLHDEAPPRTFPALALLRIALADAVPGRARRMDDEAIDGGAVLDEQPSCHAQLDERMCHVLDQPALLRRVKKTQDAR